MKINEICDTERDRKAYHSQHVKMIKLMKCL